MLGTRRLEVCNDVNMRFFKPSESQSSTRSLRATGCEVAKQPSSFTLNSSNDETNEHFFVVATLVIEESTLGGSRTSLRRYGSSLITMVSILTQPFSDTLVALSPVEKRNPEEGVV